jgi:hypothetical protein
MTVLRDTVYVMIDASLPGNCSGTSSGWIRVPPEYKSMTGLVMGLWLRGDASSVVVTAYTDAVDGSGYCSISQLNPAE